ncbi:MAG TPA: BTAD domain-containing putative transcriptional regulator [Actinocrinis sp.]|uniref:AfsR/SARP family transcriptional regulator n=1 Tax=Actinocrinis sp. TaxID=1920516 RepID=UPI002DDCB092|nr:BTAD domain-containing putative transcriptional regulator [Actinocrinis sp.]HEV3171681.1 BTAD domain-containing putative transcriptional regulator [Actinocrinis sp.]
MEFALLGPMLVRADGAPVRIPGNKQRVILAALLLRGNRVVSIDELIDLVWDDAPPITARTALHNHVMRLRRLLGPVEGERVITQAPGYVFRVADMELDVLQFTRLCEQGRELARDERWEQASCAYGDALALWRGEALLDVDCVRLRREEATRLAEAHTQAWRARIEAELNLGRHEVAIPELTRLAARFPLDEPFRAQLMLSLYRCGRRAEALDTYQSLRRVLAAELGVEPTAAVRDLHMRILSGDATLSASPAESDQPTAAKDTPAAPRHTLAQLPADIADFVGRRDEREFLASALEPDRAAVSAGRIAVVCGPGGSGKSTLAVHAAHRMRGAFPDGQLYADLRGTGAARTPGDVLGQFLRDLGADESSIPPDEDGRAALYRSQLAGRRVLILLDDACDSKQIRPLVPQTAGCAVLATSRNRLTALESARIVGLGQFAAAEAQALLLKIAGLDPATADLGAVADIAAACGRLPLAVRIAGARFAARPGWTLRDLAERLDAGRSRLDELALGDLGVRTAFELSHRLLGADQARAFRLLAVADLEHVSAPAAAALLGVDPPAAQSLAEALVDMHLLGSPRPGTYVYHDLVRVFAREAAETAEGRADVVDAVRRLATDLARTAQEATRAARPGYLEGSGESLFDSEQQARDWLDGEYRNVIDVVVQALGIAELDSELPLAALQHLQWYLRARGHWDDWRRASTAALERGARSADRRAELVGRQYLGQLAVLTGEPEAAQAHLTAALELTRELGDESAEAYTHNRLGLLHFTRDEAEAAAGCHESALVIFTRLGDARGRCTALINLGKCLAEWNQPQRALTVLEESLAVAAELGDQDSEIFARHNLARCYRKLNRYDECIATHLQCLPLIRELGYREGEAHTLADLGELYLEIARPVEALGYLTAAVDLFVQLNDQNSAAVFQVEIGKARRRLGDEEEAMRAWKVALETLETTSPAYAANVRELMARAPGV